MVIGLSDTIYQFYLSKYVMSLYRLGQGVRSSRKLGELDFFELALRASSFNFLFLTLNIIEKIRQGSDPNTDIKISDTLNTFLCSKLPENELFQIPEIKPHEEFKSIQNLDEKKAKCLDDIGISFLKLGMCVITGPLTHNKPKYQYRYIPR